MAEKTHPKKKTGRKKTSSQEESAKGQKRASTGSRAYTVVAYLSLCLFLGLIAYMVYFQAAKREALLNDPRNHRQEIVEEEEIVRGPIVDREGRVLAETLSTDSGEERSYPYGSLFAHTVGYALYGGSGLESTQNAALLSSHQNLVSQIQDDLAGNKKQGDTVVTTLDVDLQRTAWDALGNMRGAVFAVEVETGKVLVDVSKPAFDPNTVADDWDSLIAREDGVFLNRPLMGQYPPGSTFKTVTALAYLREFGTFDDFHYTCTGELSLGGFTIHCAGGAVHGEESFADAMANSCNCAFAHIAAEILDREQYRAVAESLGFNRDWNLDLPSYDSLFSMSTDMADALVMQTGIGQGDTLATPMQMCLIAQAIANRGQMLEPQFVDRIENADGTTVSIRETQPVGQVMTAAEAGELRTLLREVVLRGTATSLSDLPLSVFGKTGTAQYGDEGRSHSLFLGFTESDKSDIAFCVLVEDGGDDIYPATGVARQLLTSFWED